MMLTMTETPQFKDQFFTAFLEWEKTQPKKRSSFSAFARWLSDNSNNTLIKQQNVDAWINGTIPKDYKYVFALAEKLGDWIFDSLGFPRPNPYQQKLNRLWEFLPEEFQKRITEEAETYETKNISERVHKVSKQRKARKAK